MGKCNATKQKVSHASPREVETIMILQLDSNDTDVDGVDWVGVKSTESDDYFSLMISSQTTSQTNEFYYVFQCYSGHFKSLHFAYEILCDGKQHQMMWNAS